MKDTLLITWCLPKRSQSYRGIALVLVLAVLVITVPVAVMVARQTGINRLAHTTDQAGQLANELRRTFENGFIQPWLVRESSSVVLPPDTPVASLSLLDESWTIPANKSNQSMQPCRVRITAFDQCGMVPYELAHAGSPLRPALPEEILTQLEAINLQDLPANQVLFLGLDQFYPLTANLLETGSFDTFISPFPSHDSDQAMHAIGAWVATCRPDALSDRRANTSRARRTSPNVIININTAPYDLLETAMRSAGRSGIESIRYARTQGKMATITSSLSLTQTNSPNESSRHPVFSSSSIAWSFRMDIECGGFKKSWWMVYQPLTSNQWKCVQRLVILDS